MPIPEKEENLHRLSAKNAIYQTVCEWIITGVMKPGEKLNDGELAKYFNVSRTPVREAFQLLEAQKLIQVIPGRATVVSEIDKNDIEKCYRPLAEIQGLAVRMATPELTEDDLNQLEEIQSRFTIACRDSIADQAIECDNRFHEIIMQACGNEYMADFSQMLILHVQRIKYFYFHQDPLRKKSAQYHGKILEALQKYDGEAAQIIMRDHWLYVMERCLEEIRVMDAGHGTFE